MKIHYGTVRFPISVREAVQFHLQNVFASDLDEISVAGETRNPVTPPFRSTTVHSVLMAPDRTM
ncbi:hypothetical protein T4D_5376 [Trichinella pseudospiralis]|uniref:Uncharacterized protein n=1 Tax=Trichinella pseudospiralis TaxID=6337 RepID=A0A0V1G0E5_TRIPS|nr:hypothetical protein T4D_5376 [Trichinella pseudospiralis]